MSQPRVLSWFSSGAASAIATELTLASEPRAIPTYCDPGAEHADNSRFRHECETWFGVPITVLHSDKYADTWDVWTRRRYLAGIDGAICTTELKVIPRLHFQRPDDTHVFGYTADAKDVARATLLRTTYPELKILTPLIDAGLTKAACIAMIERTGLTPPLTYALGFPNANCLPCVKATSPAYWALVRKHFPALFERMAKLSRELDVRLCRVNGERAFIDEIPADHPVVDPIVPACDFLCAIAETNLVPTDQGDGRG